MARIDCAWDVPDGRNTEDHRDWTVAQLLAGRLAADWTVHCSGGNPSSIVLQDAAGQVQLRLDGVQQEKRCHALLVFLMDAVPRLSRKQGLTSP